MALSEPITFIVSDNSVNKFGGRVITEGIDTTEFEKNPIMLYMHLRDDGWRSDAVSVETNSMPIGRWENIRVQGEQLLADATFDLDDNLGAEVHRKVIDKVLNAASIGIDPIAFSDDESDLLVGQFRSTITKSKLLEISIVDIPANNNAMQLSGKGASGYFRFNGVQNIDELNKIYPEMENKTDDKAGIIAQVNESMKGMFAAFMEKLNANYTLTAKEGVEAPEAVNDIVAEISANMETLSFKVEAPEANAELEKLSAQFAEFKASVEAKDKEFETLKNELIELKGAGSTQIPANDKPPVSGKGKEGEKKNTQLSSLGAAIKNNVDY